MAWVGITHAYGLTGGDHITRNGVAAGNMLVVFMGNYGGVDSSITLSSLGNSYSKLATYTNNASVLNGVQCWICYNSAAGNETITFTGTHSDMGGYIIELSGRQSSGPLENQAAAGSGGGALSVASFVTTVVTDIVGLYLNEQLDKITGPGTGFDATGTGHWAHDSGHIDGVEFWSDASATTRTVAFAGTSDADNTVYFIAIKAAGGGPPPASWLQTNYWWDNL